MTQYENKAEEAMDCLEQGLDDALAIMVYPNRYHKELLSKVVFSVH